MKILFVFVLALAASLSFAQQHPQEGPEGWFPVNIATTDDLRRVQFFSRTNGWTCSMEGNAFHTTDGGDHWTQFTPPERFQYFYFTNDSTAFANGTTEDGKRMMLKKTTDRGETWSEPFIYGIPGGLSPHEDMTHIGDSIWLLNEEGLVRSTDGGKSWTEFSTPLVYQKSISFVDQKNAFIVGSIIGPEQDGGFAYTTNGGVTWTKKISHIDVDLHGVFAILKDKVLAAGSYQSIYKTTNSGSTWEKALVDSGGRIYNAIRFSDKLNGTIVGSGGSILRTTDGGDTWTRQASGIFSFLYSVSFVDSLYGWTVSGDGIVLRTRTGGFTTQGVVENEPIIIPNQIYPEPNNGVTRIRYSLPEPQNITLTLHSMSGQLVKSIPAQYQLAGENEIMLDLHSLSLGVYQFALSSPKFTSTGHLTVVQ
jgi:photosystem II stability/assembly factor-like uncharacterized protein